MTEFDLEQKYADFCESLGVPARSQGLRSLTFKGSDPVLPDKLRLGAIFAIPAAATASQIADIWHTRVGRR